MDNNNVIFLLINILKIGNLIIDIIIVCIILLIIGIFSFKIYDIVK